MRITDLSHEQCEEIHDKVISPPVTRSIHTIKLLEDGIQEDRENIVVCVCVCVCWGEREEGVRSKWEICEPFMGRD